MKKYTVFAYISGPVIVSVEAEDEEDAKWVAFDKIYFELLSSISNNIDIDINEVYKVEG